jgi:hypothetical protein
MPFNLKLVFNCEYWSTYLDPHDLSHNLTDAQSRFCEEVFKVYKTTSLNNCSLLSREFPYLLASIDGECI